MGQREPTQFQQRRQITGSNISRCEVHCSSRLHFSNWDFKRTINAFLSFFNQDAQSDAEKFHRATHMMLEWLTEAERQLQVANATPISGATPGSAPRTADEENAIEAALEAAKNFK